LRRITSLLKSREHKKIFFNIQNLFFFQGTNFIVPLITIPYIVRVIGPEKFGILSFAEALNYYFVLITDYGFNITGTQQISIERDNPHNRNNIFASIFSVKLLLMVGCAVLLLLLILSFPTIRENSIIYFLYFLIVPGNILLSYWFFLGMEEMHYLNYPNLISKIGYTLFIFLFLREESDFYLVPLFFGSFMVLGGSVSCAIIFKKFGIEWKTPSLREVRNSMKNGWSIFISTFAINLYRRSNVFILGLVAPNAAVGFYSAGEKIIKALQSAFEPITQAFYPFVARKKQISILQALRPIAYLIKWLGGGTLIIALVMVLFARPLTILALGEKFLPAVAVLRIAAFVISIGVLNYIIGIIFMTNFDFKKEFSQRVILTGLVNVFVCFVLSYFWEEVGASISFLFAEAFLLMLLVTFSMRRREAWSSPNEI